MADKGAGAEYGSTPVAWVRPDEEGGVGAGEGHTRGVGLTRPTSVGRHGEGDRHLPLQCVPS